MREQRARLRLGADGEEKAFRDLRALVAIEAQRINRLMRCIVLRTMIMPSRYSFLQEVTPIQGKPRQPVPTGLSGEAYLTWLLEVATKLRPRFHEARRREAKGLALDPQLAGRAGPENAEAILRVW